MIASFASVLSKPIAQRRKWEQGRYERIYNDGLEKADYLPDKYRASYGKSNHGHYAIPLIRQLGIKSLVDVGTGKGDFVREAYIAGVQQVFGYDFVIPTDQFKCQLGLNGYTEGRKMILQQAFAHALPLPDKEVEAVTSFDMLEHLWEDELDEVFTEWLRVGSKYWILSVSHSPSSFTVSGANLHHIIKPPEWWRQKIMLFTGREMRLFRDHTSCFGPTYMWIEL
jgi:hypothetical protein